MSAPRPGGGASRADVSEQGVRTAEQREARPDVSGQSVGQLLSEISQDLSTLLRQEVELAKAEIKTEVAKAGKGAGMLGGAGFGGYMVLLFLSFAAWWGLANVMDQGWAALIVAGIWAVIAVVLAIVGRTTLKRVNPKPNAPSTPPEKSLPPSRAMRSAERRST